MSTNLHGKVIAITGAASGIGLATSKMLASRGAIVALADINEALLESATKEIASTGTVTSTTVLDVRDRKAVESWIAGIVQEHGCLNGAANMAGVIGKQIGLADIEDIEDDDWDFVLGVNLKGTLNCMRAEIRAMGDPEENGNSTSIVNASSIAGIQGMPRNGAYIASKHAIVGLTKTAAKECASRAIRVNAIAPGPIDTPMVKRAKDIGHGTLVDFIPMGREGKPDEVAELICWLLCDGSSYMTGTIQSIDGGWAC